MLAGMGVEEMIRCRERSRWQEWGCTREDGISSWLVRLPAMIDRSPGPQSGRLYNYRAR